MFTVAVRFRPGPRSGDRLLGGRILGGHVSRDDQCVGVKQIYGAGRKAYDIFVAGLRETVYGNSTAVTRELQILPSTHGDHRYALAGALGAGCRHW